MEAVIDANSTRKDPSEISDHEEVDGPVDKQNEMLIHLASQAEGVSLEEVSASSTVNIPGETDDHGGDDELTIDADFAVRFERAAVEQGAASISEKPQYAEDQGYGSHDG
jgi:hypothetical protein